MIITTIKFVGLIVTTLLTPPNPPGVQLIMGDFPISDPPHIRLIAWPVGSRDDAMSTWPKAGAFTAANGTRYEYSLVALQNVTITGPTEPFNVALDKIPHLTCCCLPFGSGFKPQWGDPAYSGADRKSAFFTSTHGTYITVPESTGAISTALGISDRVDITFEGISDVGVQKIVIRPPEASVEPFVLLVANTPLAVLEGDPIHAPSTTDFPNYYLMGKDTASCDALPGTKPPPPNPCAPSTDACLTTELRRQFKTPTLHNVAKKLVAATRKSVKGTMLMVDVNCSSSQWP
jgi:hypothetical protein